MFFTTTGIVLANNMPYSNEFVPEEDIVTDGSTYAIGKLTPEAFSILEIPETTIWNRLTIKEYYFSGKTPFWNASLTFSNGFNYENHYFD